MTLFCLIIVLVWVPQHRLVCSRLFALHVVFNFLIMAHQLELKRK